MRVGAQSYGVQRAGSRKGTETGVGTCHGCPTPSGALGSAGPGGVRGSRVAAREVDARCEAASLGKAQDSWRQSEPWMQ
eukprot:1161628-Pelagomonas_calceolata.AAC.6